MSSVNVVLPEKFKIDVVADVFEEMQQLLDQGESIVLSGAAVESIDFCGLQTLCALSAALTVKGVALQWQDTSDVLLEAVHLAGFGETLGLAS
ncbi:MAG: STAS domain-containing protein [Pseudomonadales bacterium]